MKQSEFARAAKRDDGEAHTIAVKVLDYGTDASSALCLVMASAIVHWHKFD
ncbi:hypothetical protein [Kineosporia babensis]|uniref:Uncharacterized protein n=1 Tax=Kineosporia babensis TaxID=499548 RepID=A0A9X1SYF8_9ACTN|nr:hypothetical protein [Kineosporia babensis]MCD5316869.1 hypothetical protein [Kineosporia babensis]